MVVAIVGAIGACAIGLMMMKNSFSPSNAAKVASEMVTLPDPLPKGWVYGVGINIGYQKSANLQNTKHGKGHALIQFNQMQGTRSAEAVADKFAMPNVAGMTFEVESKGEEKIGGQTAYYIRQHGTVMGKKSAVEIALLDLPDGGILQIQSTEDGLDKFDTTIVEPLLKSIKSIGNPSATNATDSQDTADSKDSKDSKDIKDNTQSLKTPKQQKILKTPKTKLDVLRGITNLCETVQLGSVKIGNMSLILGE